MYLSYFFWLSDAAEGNEFCGKKMQLISFKPIYDFFKAPVKRKTKLFLSKEIKAFNFEKWFELVEPEHSEVDLFQ